MNNLVQEPMPTVIPATFDRFSQREARWKPLRPASSLYYSAVFSVLSPISAIGVLALLSHFLIQR